MGWTNFKIAITLWKFDNSNAILLVPGNQYNDCCVGSGRN